MSAQKRKDTPLLAVAAESSAEKDKSRAAHCCAAPPASNVSVLRQAEHLQRWPIDSRSNREAIVGLETPPTLRVFAIRGVLGPQRGNDRFVNGLRCARFGRDSGPECVRRSDFSADLRRCDFFDQACC